eukprot:768531-Hanusia_phi.AAC.7
MLDELEGEVSGQGGEFLANRDGLSHYVRTGYKVRRRGKGRKEEMQGGVWFKCVPQGAHVGGANAVEVEYTEKEEETNWQRVAYKFNRSIIIDGSIPHCRFFLPICCDEGGMLIAHDSSRVKNIQPPGK